MSNNTVLITGFAQLPKGNAFYDNSKSIAVILVINIDSEIIEGVEFTFMSDLKNGYLASLVKGYCLKNGINPLINKLKKSVLTPSQGAIIQTLKSAWDRYNEMRDFNLPIVK
ncbi:DUF3870 domain-containing protein [Cytobacillus kochii]|uniref:DUF3870 domain-containing protein n=1 Tax=Cytobacillus kochii TaxID=859143 RepID=UPI002E1BB9A6|nr:DUF3870 domain-containing protein [Cytobacillus kochii]